MTLLDVQGRQQTNDILGCADCEKTSLAQPGDESRSRNMELQSEQQAMSAQFFDDSGMLCGKSGEILLKRTGHSADALEETGLEHDIEDSISSRHRKRISTISGTMGSYGHAAGGTFGRKACPQRKTAADSLSDGHDVRSDTRLLIGEQPPCASHSSLHLVKNQEQPVKVAKLAQAPEKPGRWNTHAHFTLDRLDQDTGCRLQHA